MPTFGYIRSHCCIWYGSCFFALVEQYIPIVVFRFVEKMMSKAELTTVVDSFVAALREGDEAKARAIVQHTQASGVDAGEIYLHLFAPSMVQIGALWEHNQLTVAEEHLATAVTERLIGELSPLFRTTPNNDHRIVLGCVQGENHTLGIRMLSDLLTKAGWRVLYLGANVPTEEWPQIVARTNANAVGISVNSNRLLPEVRRAAMLIRSRLPGICVLVGGAAIVNEPDLAELVRADVVALEPLAAIDALNALV